MIAAKKSTLNVSDMDSIYKMTIDPRRGQKGDAVMPFNKGIRKNSEALNLDIPSSGIKIHKGENTVPSYQTTTLKIKKPIFQCSLKTISVNNSHGSKHRNVKAIRGIQARM